MRCYAVHCHQPSLHCQPLQPRFRLVEHLPSDQMPRDAYEISSFRLSQDFCRLIWCPPSLFGANVWSWCGGLPPHEYLGQKLALWIGDPHHSHLLIERRPSNISVGSNGAGSNPGCCPRPPPLACLCDPNCPDLPPVVSAGSEMDGQKPRFPLLDVESVCCFRRSCCYCWCRCCGFLFSTGVTSDAVAFSMNSSKVSTLMQVSVISPTLCFSELWRPAQAIS